MDALKPGLTGISETRVTEGKTALHLGSGGLNVFATPAMLALMEAAAVQAIDHLLSEGHSSVGIALDVKHVAATPLGHKVRAEATVTAIDGLRVYFTVRAWDEAELIGEGSHERFIIDLARFEDRVAQKSNTT